jgi:hypothetical protein
LATRCMSRSTCSAMRGACCISAIRNSIVSSGHRGSVGRCPSPGRGI